MDIEKKIWEDRIFPNFDDNLTIHFETPVWEEESEYRVSLEIFWKKDKTDCYRPKEIIFSVPGIIDYTFRNGIRIKGTLQIKRFKDFESRDTLGIFADFYYYKKKTESYIWHTEGFLISFDPRMPIVVPIETIEIIDEPVIRKPEKITTVDVNPVVTNAYSDLFPYIYVSGWPTANASEMKWSFFTYAPPAVSPPSPCVFTEKLVSLKSSGDRKGMEAEAVTFIEGEAPYQLQYVANVDDLQGYIGSFRYFYRDLEKIRNLTTIVERTCLFFESTVANFSTYLKSGNYQTYKEQLWESYFALIIEMGYSGKNFEEIIKVLTLCNFLENVFSNLNTEQHATTLNETALLQLFHATIILDNQIFPLPAYTSSPPVPNFPTILPYAIGDLQLVKYKLLRYEIGEMASITSIMPGEKRKLVNRKLDRVVEKEITKTESLTASHTSSNEQNNDFNEELWNAIAETTETTNYPDPGLISTYGPPTNITIKGSFTKAYTTQTPDKKQLSSFAKKILNKTTQRLSEKINKVRAHTELKELEDTSVSFLNNTNSNEPVYGIYCWLNKIYQAKVINYGNRMLFSFIVPNPAAAYIQQTKILDGANLTEPKSLEQFHITTYQDITRDNYLALCQYYALQQFPLPPQETILVSDVVSLSQSKLIPLPEGYYASSANLDYAFGAGQTEAVVSGFLGQNTFTFDRSTALIGSKNFSPLSNEQLGIAVSVVYNPGIQMSPPDSELDFQMAVAVSCVPLAQTFLSWQINLYQLLAAAYSQQLAVYQLKIDASLGKKDTVNPLSERLTVKQELEKSIRKQLVENALQVKGLPLSLINSAGNGTFQYNQSEILQYLNMALEWNEMSYTFFDQYDIQNDLFAVSSLSSDFFSAFLKASYARVIIPIPPDFNYGFLYFLNTGIVWTLKDSLAPCFQDGNDATGLDQSSMVYEIKKTFHGLHPKPELIDAWEVLIPTSMQILQNKKSLNIKNHE